MTKNESLQTDDFELKSEIFRVCLRENGGHRDSGFEDSGSDSPPGSMSSSPLEIRSILRPKERPYGGNKYFFEA